MKILQLNIWGGRLGKQIIEVVEREKPDAICFQEVITLPIDDDFLFNGLQKFKKSGGYEHVFSSPMFDFSYMNQEVGFGNAILSKHPFSDTETIFTGGEYAKNIDMFGGDFDVRNLQHAIVDVNGTKINILNHHGYHIGEHKNGNEETMRQCKMIVDYMEKLEGAIVLCGDFNLSPESESLEQINKVLVNHAKNSEIITTRNQLTHKTEVCDFIFTSKDIGVTNFQVLDDMVSDHKALIIEF